MPQCETRNSLGNPEKLLVSQLLCPYETPMKNSFPGRGHSQLNCHVSYMKVCLFLSLLIEIRSPLCYSELLSRSVSPASAPWIAETTFSPACPAVSEVLKGPPLLHEILKKMPRTQHSLPIFRGCPLSFPADHEVETSKGEKGVTRDIHLRTKFKTESINCLRLSLFSSGSWLFLPPKI